VYSARKSERLCGLEIDHQIELEYRLEQGHVEDIYFGAHYEVTSGIGPSPKSAKIGTRRSQSMRIALIRRFSGTHQIVDGRC
jgi:hypothetical protein